MRKGNNFLIPLLLVMSFNESTPDCVSSLSRNGQLSGVVLLYSSLSECKTLPDKTVVQEGKFQ